MQKASAIKLPRVTKILFIIAVVGVIVRSSGTDMNKEHIQCSMQSMDV